MSESTDPRPRPPLPGVPTVASYGLLAVAVAALAVAAFTDLFSLFAEVRLRSLIDGDGGFATAPQQELDAATSLYDTAAWYQTIVYLPCAIAFIAWFFQMRRKTGPLAPDGFHRGPGWAIGVWLIPLANFWMPYRVAFDMWGAATSLPADGSPADGERYRARVWPVNLWWGLFVFSMLLNWYAGRNYGAARTLTEIKEGVVLYMAADVLHILAAAAAVYFAVQLTAMQRLKAVEGPFRTAAVKNELV
ncbi:DUF4328 domain-containing protein [Streptomyces sp. GMY02]|uniref:DUF4328 domain-containing protein n=1 Tax=Streptomyces sp. GMY02 TaxID=1333528 RepID=UPI001C2C6459|nr:DUF4328 domain-containing protein [Streptomyces sp. GMY02]QXE36265.1 DUF4328 domain-containing protein [Streptomyces sp. GMY02]